MPFFGINPPANRVAGLFGGSLPVATISSAPLSNIVDASAQMQPGQIGWYKDVNGKISILAYAQAFASIPFGTPLIHQAGLGTTLNSAGVSTQNGLDQGFVRQARTADGGQVYNFAGVAAASVINTGYYFWRYVSGYVPYAALGSAIPSGNPIIVSASTAGQLGSMGAQFNATLGTTNFNTLYLAVGWSLGLSDNAAGSMGSITLNGWYV